MQLVAMKCPACAASVNFDNDQTSFKCSYCHNQISVIKPISVSSILEGLNETEQKKYSNYLSILEQSMIAGNYVEAYNYCNKALEINPKSGSLWENKAICAFWLSTLDNLSNEKSGEILTYLNASRNNDPDSKTYDATALSISENIFMIAEYKYTLIGTSTVNGKIAYSIDAKKEFGKCIYLLETCYQINPDIKYLKKAVELIARGKIRWLWRTNKYLLLATDIGFTGFDPKLKMEHFINTIKSVEPTYEPPLPDKKPINKTLIIVAIIAFLILMKIMFGK